MKSPGGRGGHSRTAQDDALVKKKKKTGSLACKFCVSNFTSVR